VVKETFFLFGLGEVDLIFGVTWLASLGDVQVNWKTLTMSFNTQNQQIQIKGDLTFLKTTVTGQNVMEIITCPTNYNCCLTKFNGYPTNYCLLNSTSTPIIATFVPLIIATIPLTQSYLFTSFKVACNEAPP